MQVLVTTLSCDFEWESNYVVCTVFFKGLILTTRKCLNVLYSCVCVFGYNIIAALKTILTQLTVV
jgi:hypothetical protein